MSGSKATSYFTIRPDASKNPSVIIQDAAFYAEDGTPLNESIAKLDSTLEEKAPIDHVHDNSDGGVLTGDPQNPPDDLAVGQLLYDGESQS